MSNEFVALGSANSRGAKDWRTNDLVNTGVLIKSGPGNFYGGFVYNSNAAARFLKIYDRSIAATNSDIPIATIFCEPLKHTPIPAPAQGVELVSGLSVRATTGLADNDNTAPTAGDLYATLYFF